MIGTFWNLCRACPLPIDKGRSEYRSTYQWYEYTGNREEVVKQSPQFTTSPPPRRTEDVNGFLSTIIQKVSSEKVPDMLIRNPDEGPPKKEVNIKNNPIYGKKEVINGKTDENVNLPTETNGNINKFRSRNYNRDYPASRRSKSAGPPGTGRRHEPYGNCFDYTPSMLQPETINVMDDDVKFLNEYTLLQNNSEEELPENLKKQHNPNAHSEYRLQFIWPKSKPGMVEGVTSDDPKSIVRRVFVPTTAAPVATAVTTEEHQQPVLVHKKRPHDMPKHDTAVAAELEPLVKPVANENIAEGKNLLDKPERRIDFYSEYRKNFRPFSHYEYVAGKFLRKEDYTDSSSQSASWYEEVLELRKKAGEYKHRAWGTELVPQHLAEVYNQQIALWEHVSRRSSLSALTLATTTQKPRALTKAAKNKEHLKKAIPGRARDVSSLSRQQSVDRSGSASYKKIERTDEGKRATSRSKKDIPIKHTTTSNQSIQNASYRRLPSRSATQYSSSSRPTTLPANSSELVNRNKDFPDVSRSGDKLTMKAANAANDDIKLPQFGKLAGTGIMYKSEDRDTSADSATEEIVDYGPVVKSPPEPTRIRSPEQILIRSPEPVVWTVPLDTGKVFTVTQNLPTAPESKHVRFNDEVKAASHRTGDKPTADKKSPAKTGAVGTTDDKSDKSSSKPDDEVKTKVEDDSISWKLKEKNEVTDFASYAEPNNKCNDEVDAIDDGKLGGIDTISSVVNDN